MPGTPKAAAEPRGHHRALCAALRLLLAIWMLAGGQQAAVAGAAPASDGGGIGDGPASDGAALYEPCTQRGSSVLHAIERLRPPLPGPLAALFAAAALLSLKAVLPGWHAEMARNNITLKGWAEQGQPDSACGWTFTQCDPETGRITSL